MKKKIKTTFLFLFCCLATACVGHTGNTKDTEDAEEPEPLVIEAQDFKDTEEFRDAVDAALNEKLSGDVTVTVYADGVEAFCYYGTAEVVDDGGLHLIINASGRTDEGDWF